MIRWVETFESNSSPSSRNSSGKKRRRKRKERRSRMIEECYVNEEVGRKSSSLINYSSTFRARHARYPPKLERTCSRCQIRLDSAKWITSLHLPTLPAPSTQLSTLLGRCILRAGHNPLSPPPPLGVDLCVCSRKIKLSHYRATAVDRSLFWRQEV